MSNQKIPVRTQTISNFRKPRTRDAGLHPSLSQIMAAWCGLQYPAVMAGGYCLATAPFCNVAVVAHLCCSGGRRPCYPGLLRPAISNSVATRNFQPDLSTLRKAAALAFLCSYPQVLNPLIVVDRLHASAHPLRYSWNSENSANRRADDCCCVGRTTGGDRQSIARKSPSVCHGILNSARLRKL